MKKTTFFGVTGFAVLTLIFLSAFKAAPGPGDHPNYLHALTNLRSARWLLEHRPGNWKQTMDEITAVKEIDMAIMEIKKGDIDDKHDNSWKPEVKEVTDRPGRLKEAVDFLHMAQADVKMEDPKFANGLKGKTLQHVDAATASAEKAVHAQK